MRIRTYLRDHSSLIALALLALITLLALGLRLYRLDGQCDGEGLRDRTG